MLGAARRRHVRRIVRQNGVGSDPLQGSEGPLGRRRSATRLDGGHGLACRVGPDAGSLDVALRLVRHHCH